MFSDRRFLTWRLWRRSAQCTRSKPPPPEIDAVPLLREFFRYGLVSGGALGVDVTILRALTSTGLHYLASAAVGFIAGLVINYALSVRLVFRHRHAEPRDGDRSDLPETLNELLMWGVAGRLGYHPLTAKLLSTGLGFVWNYSARKLLVFR